MRTLQRRLVRVAAAAVAVVALAALPTGAKASLIGDIFTLTSQTGVVCTPCVDNTTVTPGTEFFIGDTVGPGGTQSGVSTFLRHLEETRPST